MKSFESLISFRRGRSNHKLERVVTPGQATISGVVVLLASAWPGLSFWFHGYPSNWFTEFVFLLCTSISILAAPSLLLAVAGDMVRGRSPQRLILAFLLSLAAVAASWGFLFLRIQGYDFHM